MENRNAQANLFFGLAPEKAELLLSVLLAMLLSSLDQTIVSTAMPTIVSQLGGLEMYAWVFTAYMITSTIAIVMSGKLGDMFGRKGIYSIGIITFILGSVFAGLSQSMLFLVLARGLQGIGGGIMMVSAMAVIGDLFAPAERGKYQGMIAAVFAISSLVGPAAGAFITGAISWHWVFFVNVPLGLLVLYLMSRAKHITPKTHGHEIDVMGSLWFTVFIFSLMIYFSWVPASYDFFHSVLPVISLVSLALFIREEHRAREPILPPDLFSSRVFSISVAAVFASSLAMFGVITFLPLFVQGVLGGGVQDASAAITPLMLSIVAGSVLAGQVISRTGGYKLVGITAGIIASIGLFLLSGLHAGSSSGDVLFAVIVLGFGIGPTMPLFTIVVQNAFDKSRLGTVSSAVSFFRSLGGAMGGVLMGAMLNLSGTGAVGAAVEKAALLAGLKNAFLLCLLISVIPIILLFFLEEIPLRRKPTEEELIAGEAGVRIDEERAF